MIGDASGRRHPSVSRLGSAVPCRSEPRHRGLDATRVKSRREGDTRGRAAGAMRRTTQLDKSICFQNGVSWSVERFSTPKIKRIIFTFRIPRRRFLPLTSRHTCSSQLHRRFLSSKLPMMNVLHGSQELLQCFQSLKAFTFYSLRG